MYAMALRLRSEAYATGYTRCGGRGKKKGGGLNLVLFGLAAAVAVVIGMHHAAALRRAGCTAGLAAGRFAALVSHLVEEAKEANGLRRGTH